MLIYEPWCATGIVVPDTLYDYLCGQEDDRERNQSGGRQGASERTRRPGRGWGFDRHHPARQAGRAAHRRSAPPRKRIDAALLQSLTATMPSQTETAADLVRSMRDGDRY